MERDLYGVLQMRAHQRKVYRTTTPYSSATDAVADANGGGGGGGREGADCGLGKVLSILLVHAT